MGVIQTEERPSVEELHDNISSRSDFRDREVNELESGEERVFQERGRNAYVQDPNEEYGYCHFRYVGDSEESYRIREDGEEKDKSDLHVKDTRVMYFSNGQFIIQSNQDLEYRWIPRFIGNATGHNFEGGDYQFYTLGEYFLKDAYDDHTFVSRIKVSEPTGSAASVSSEVGQFVRNLIGEVNSFEFNGAQGENLKTKDAIDKCAKHLGIRYLKAKHDDDTMKEFTRKSITKPLDYENAGDPDIMEKVRRESTAARRAMKEELKRAKRVYGV